MEKQPELKPKKRTWAFWAAGAVAILAVTATLAKLIGWPLGNARAHNEKQAPVT